MSRKGIGRIMKEALKGRLPSEEESGITHGLMMNPLRRPIYSELTRAPASSISALARILETTPSTVRWHIGKLLVAGFLEVSKAGRSRLYFPSRLVEKRHLRLLSTLSSPVTKAVFNEVQGNPNSSLGALSKALKVPRQTVRYHTDVLEEYGVITGFRQDRHRRFVSTDVLERLSERKGREVLTFKTALLKLLKTDGVNPTVIRTRSHSILLRIGIGDEKAVLEAYTNPFVTVLGQE